MKKICPRCLAEGYGEFELIRLPQGTGWGNWRCPNCFRHYFDTEIEGTNEDNH